MYLVDILMILVAAVGWLYALALRREARKLADGIVEWKVRGDEAAFVAKQQKDLADVRLGYMADYEKERDSIWKIYRQMSLSAGAAQNWLLREYERAMRVLNGYRKEKGEKPITIDPRLQALLSEFGAVHPAENMEAVQAAITAQSTPQVAEPQAPRFEHPSPRGPVA